MQAPLPYMPVPQPSWWDVDQGHLKTLAICHYVWGGLSLLLSCFFIIYIVLGYVMLHDPNVFAPPPGSPAPAAAQQPPPEFLGWMFIAIGSGGVLFGWTAAVLTIVSGRGIATQRRRTFSLVMAGVDCLSIPLGTLLGVFTFVVLLRPSVAALYEQRARERQAAGGAAPGAAAA